MGHIYVMSQLAEEERSNGISGGAAGMRVVRRRYDAAREGPTDVSSRLEELE